jgi:hypothetical protein
MALPASDAFTGDNYTALQTYSASWTINAGAFRLLSNRVCPHSGSFARSTAHWNADSFDNDQYSAGVYSIVDTNQSGSIGVGVRVAAAANSAYYYEVSTGWGGRGLSKVINGTHEELAWVDGAPTNGATYRLEIEGTTLTPMVNGSTDAGLGADTVTDLSSGYAGITGCHEDDRTGWTSWEGGNLGAGAQTVTHSSIASGAALGQPTVTPGAVSVAPNGIASGVALGQPAVRRTVKPSGIDSTAALGQPSVQPGAVTVQPESVGPTATLGEPTITQAGGAQVIGMLGIGPTATLGQPGVQPGPVAVAPDSLGSGSALGQPSVGMVVKPDGIASGATLGEPSVTPGAVTVQPESVESAESMGEAAVQPGAVTIQPEGIASAESMGEPAVRYVVLPLGIGSAAQLGEAAMLVGGVTVEAMGILSVEALGLPVVVIQALVGKPRFTFTFGQRIKVFGPAARTKVFSFGQRVKHFDDE